MRTTMDENKLQLIADKLTDIAMARTFGMEYINCEDITEDDVMSNEWEYLNENFFELLKSELD